MAYRNTYSQKISVSSAQVTELLTRLYGNNWRREGREATLGNIEGKPGNSLKVDLNTGMFIDFADDTVCGSWLDLIALKLYGRKDKASRRNARLWYLAEGSCTDWKELKPQRKEYSCKQKLANQEIITRILAQSTPIWDTVAEKYLINRKLDPAGVNNLHFHPNLKHTPSNRLYPALVAKVGDSAIHRIYLTQEGKKAALPQCKMALGSITGNAAQLYPAEETIGIAEGIETAIAARMLYNVPVWSAISGGNMKNLSFPSIVKNVIIFADNGEAGRKYALRAKESLSGLGLSAYILRPKSGDDFNDELVGME